MVEPPLRACFVIDDPNLHWPSYGHLDYRRMAEHARRGGYHVESCIGAAKWRWLPMSQAAMSEASLDKLQRNTFEYFLAESNRANGMVPDNTREGSHASITAIGFALDGLHHRCRARLYHTRRSD